MRNEEIIELAGINLDEAVQSYITSKLDIDHDELSPWADNDLPDEIAGVDRSEHGEILDFFYSEDDIDPDFVAAARAHLVDFIVGHPLAVRMYLAKRTSEDFGYDFLLTRDRHGTGFWDRGLGQLGRYLTDLCKPYGESGSLSDGALCSDPAGVKVYEAGKLYG